jgi:nucleoid-associated protein YgaU
MPKKYTEEEPTVYDFFRFGESYTSLILGIIVVIVSTVLLLSFVHNKNKTNTPNQNTVVRVSPTSTPESTVMLSPSVTPKPTTVAPTKAPKPTATPAPKVVVKKPAPTATPAAKVKPTKYVAKAVTPTPVKKPTVTPTTTQTKIVNQPSAKVESKGTYVVVKGDNLWVIAEKNYKSGYNWVDIARVNNLSNPGTIHVGDKLVLPKVESKVVTHTVGSGQAVVTPTKLAPQPTKVIAKVVSPTPVAGPSKITGTSYKVVLGDNLWTIAVRAYGDGYQWVNISNVNKLVNPNLIHPGNVLTIPRK